MKTDVLLANYQVIRQDMTAKIADIVACLKLLNELFDVHKLMLSEIYVDKSTKSLVNTEKLQVWSDEDLDRTMQEVNEKLDMARDDNLICVQLTSEFNERSDLKRFKDILMPIAHKFDEGGLYAQMDASWIRWIKNLLYSGQVWSDILAQRLSLCNSIFDDISELIFLADKAFPFVLDQIRRISQESKQPKAKLDDFLSQWKDMSLFLKGIELKLNHLKSKLDSKWAEGSKEMNVLLEDVHRLKKMVGFLWGESSATRVYNRLLEQIQIITKSINSMHGEKNLRYNKTNLTNLAEKVFHLVVVLRQSKEDFGSLENQFSKYKSLNVQEVKIKVNNIRYAYETLCTRLAGFEEDELALKRRKGETTEDTKNEKKGGIARRHATTPELNNNFINGGKLALIKN